MYRAPRSMTTRNFVTMFCVSYKFDKSAEITKKSCNRRIIIEIPISRIIIRNYY